MPPPPLTGDLTVDVVDVAVGNMDMVVSLAGVAGQNMDTEQCPLILVGPVGIGDFNPVNFPEFHILQEDAGCALPQHIDDRLVAPTVGLEADGGVIRSTSSGREHTLEDRSPLEGNSVTRSELSLFVAIEVSLRIDAIHRRIHGRSNNKHQ